MLHCIYISNRPADPLDDVGPGRTDTRPTLFAPIAEERDPVWSQTLIFFSFFRLVSALIFKTGFGARAVEHQHVSGAFHPGRGWRDLFWTAVSLGKPGGEMLLST